MTIELRHLHAFMAIADEGTTTLLRRWRTAQPQTPLKLLRIDDRSAGLTRGRTDVALLRSKINIPGVRLEPPTTERRLADPSYERPALEDPGQRRLAVIPADSPLAAHPALRLADLIAYPLALSPVSGDTTWTSDRTRRPRSRQSQWPTPTTGWWQQQQAAP